ncbi:MAG: hypothetical protein ABSA05_14250, partial [Opitutaceae bacterium]
LDALHERHFLACYNRGQTKEEKGRLGNAAQAELSERYTVYYKAWPDMDPSRAKEYFSNVSFEMAQSFFPSRKPVIDVSLQVMIPLEIAGFIEQAKKLRKTVAITDS